MLVLRSLLLCHARKSAFFTKQRQRQQALFMTGGSSGSSSSNNHNNNDTNDIGSSNNNNNSNNNHNNNNDSLYYSVSVCAVQGGRSYMEDEYCVNPSGTFGAVFDGHGGPAVSRYLRQNLYANLQNVMGVVSSTTTSTTTSSTTTSSTTTFEGKQQQQQEQKQQNRKQKQQKQQQQKQQQHYGRMEEQYYRALVNALHKVDTEVQRISHWSFQGSTAVAAWILPDVRSSSSSSISSSSMSQQQKPQRTLIVANIGDSRAVLSYNDYTAMALTQDHKPNAPRERARIEARGGKVVWSGLVDRDGKPVPDHGVYRVNGNLALSRAIGDRSERPAISAEPECTIVTLDDTAQFVILATDGLWDVMTSQEAVSFCQFKLQAQEDEPSRQIMIQKKMAEYLVAEALRRGTVDNVTVVILWL